MKSTVSLIIILIFLFSGCQEIYSPKPRGYFRIQFPEKKYQSYDRKESGCPFYFEYPVYGVIQAGQQPCWLNIEFPDFNAKLHLTYLPVNNVDGLYQLTEDARTLAFKHAVKATGIDQSRLQGATRDVGGLLYEIRGNTASNLQFFLTDSSKHYIRGALYFNEKPRIDSIQPVLEFLKKDLDRFVEGFQWKSNSF